MKRHPFQVVTHGTTVGTRGGRLEARLEGRLVASAPLLGVSEVVLEGNAHITTPALHTLLDEGVPVVLLRGDGRARGRLEPPANPHADIRRAQLERSLDTRARNQLAAAIAAAKLHNQARLLTTLARRSGDPDRLRVAAAELRAAAAKVDRQPLETIRGLEGSAARVYFAALRLLVADHVAAFPRRDRHGGDLVNTLLNYVSALLRETVIGELVRQGLDPNLGLIHHSYRARPAFALDLMEEWRPVLLERTVLTLIRRRQVVPSNVVSDYGRGGRLDPIARRAAIHQFRARLDAHHGSSTGRTTLQRRLRAQVTAAREWIVGDTDTYRGFRWH